MQVLLGAQPTRICEAAYESYNLSSRTARTFLAPGLLLPGNETLCQFFPLAGYVVSRASQWGYFFVHCCKLGVAPAQSNQK